MTPCNIILGERNGKNTPHFLFDFAYIHRLKRWITTTRQHHTTIHAHTVTILYYHSLPSHYRSYRCVKCNNKYSSPEALDHHHETTSHNYPCPHCNNPPLSLTFPSLYRSYRCVSLTLNPTSPIITHSLTAISLQVIQVCKV